MGWVCVKVMEMSMSMYAMHVYHHDKFECRSWNIVPRYYHETTSEKKSPLSDAVVTFIEGQGHRTEKDDI